MAIQTTFPPFTTAILIGCWFGAISLGEPPPIGVKQPSGEKDSKKLPNFPALPMFYELTIKRQGDAEVREIVPGYYDQASDTFFALKGILFNESPDPFNPYRRPRVLISGQTKYNRAEIAPPIAYLTLGKDKFAPGSYVEEWAKLYRWKGITLSSDELPAKDPKKPYSVLPEKTDWLKVYEVAPPKYLMDNPEVWKKTKTKEK